MRGSQSASPDSSSAASGRSRRRFTVSEANRSLPLVRRIVTDIVGTHAQAIAVQSHIGRATPKEQGPLQSQLERLLERLEDFVDELTEVGCELKDYSVGLVDFTGRHKGRDVYLCWKLGEEQVAHWHELDAGAAGRKSIRTLREEE